MGGPEAHRQEIRRKGILISMNGVRFKRGLAVLLGFLLILGMIGGHVSQTVYAKERRTVRVAFFTINGYN